MNYLGDWNNKTRESKPGVDLTGSPLIDLDHCEALADAGLFGEYGDLAIQLHNEGVGRFQVSDPDWMNLVDRLRDSLEKIVDSEALSKGKLAPSRFQDAWLHYGLDHVRQIACHPEVINILRLLYGREPFPFQTLNFPNGSEQHFHSDAVHFHSLPTGFMCGVWVALEDIQLDAGPLIYFPRSHKEPYLRARDLGVTNAALLAEEAPQRLFEQYWRDLVKRKQYQPEMFLAQKGEVLVWHANLLHGGAEVRNKNLSRWSQVSHYYFRECAYTTPLKQTIDGELQGEHWRESPLDLTK